MKERAFIIAALLLFTPALALADGSTSYTTPGTYTFTVPAYGTLTVDVWGGGASGSGWTPDGDQGGGGGGFSQKTYAPGALTQGSQISLEVAYGGTASRNDVCGWGANGGTNGGVSEFNSYDVYASGGSQGNGYSGYTGLGYGGSGAGGSVNGTGGSGSYAPNPYGGNGYSGGAGGAPGSAGAAPGGGGGGGTDSCGYSGAGAAGEVYISWTDPVPPTCSVSLSPNPSSYAYSGTPVTLSWSSSNASQVYLDNIGWVGTSGSTQVASQSSTDYSCYGYSSSYGDGSWNSTNATLTVNAPPSPTITISASPTSIQVGQSSTITATFAPGSGDQLTDDTVNIGSTSVIPYSTQTTRTYQFTPSSAGTTTFLPYLMTGYYSSWNTWGNSVNVTVTDPPPTATLSVSPASITQGGKATLSWSSTNATSCTGTNFTTAGATSGSTSVSPSQTTTYTGSCTGPGGTANFNSGSGSSVSVSCEESWSCSGTTIVQTNTDCSTTDLSTCSAPQFCQAGSSICLAPAISFNSSGNDTGHLQLLPDIVKPGASTQVNWNVSDAESCSVKGTNGDSWSGLSGDQTSAPINAQVTYTLSCSAYAPNPNVVETQAVDVTPVYEEK